MDARAAQPLYIQAATILTLGLISSHKLDSYYLTTRMRCIDRVNIHERLIYWLKFLIPLKFTIEPALPPETFSADQSHDPVNSSEHSQSQQWA
jgi:hypothetical protein